MLPTDQSKYVTMMVALGKQANEEQHADWAKDILDKALTHHTTAGLLGAGAGATTGAITGKKGHKLKSMLAGVGIGAGVGVGASFAAPEISKDTNEQLVKHLIRQPLGRVITNTIEPYTYSSHENDLKEYVKNNGVLDVLKHIVKDEPIYKITDESYRDPIFRNSFDLKSRSFAPDTPESPFHKVHDKLWELKDPTAEGKLLKGPTPLQEVKNLANLLNTNGQAKGSAGGHSIMGNYNLTKQDDGAYHYRDKWDFDLHKDEHISQGKHINKSNLIRYLIDKSISPVTVAGKVYAKYTPPVMFGGDPAITPIDPGAVAFN